MDYAGAACAVHGATPMKLTHARHFSRYVLVGIANTIIYLLLLLFFLSHLGLFYPVAIGSAFIIAMCFQYLANKRFTFGSIDRSKSEVARYLVVAAINYLTSVFVYWLGAELAGIPIFYASLLSAVSVAVSGYILSFYWVYKN